MKSIITTCFLSALSLTHLSSAQQEQFPFTASTPSFPTGAGQAPVFSNFTHIIQNNRISYEKERAGTMFYRVKITQKNQGTGYSAILHAGKNQVVYQFEMLAGKTERR